MICAACTEEISGGDSCPRCGQPTALEGRYRLLEVVGHGAVGTTYRAERLEDGRTVAIKEMMVRKVERAKALELFEREARVLSQLDHPGIPKYFESFSCEAQRSVALYLAQEFIEGQTLAREFENKRVTGEETFAIVAELLDTLGYLATLRPPVIHRDIKPGNIMRRARGDALVLIDFGAVRAAVDTAEGGSTVAGTFGYMAPEQLMGRALPATDLYGLGATALALLTRQDPSRLIGEDRQLAIPTDLGLQRDLDAALRWMLAPAPEDRPQDARRLAEHLRKLLRGETSALAVPTTSALVPVPEAPRGLPARFEREHAASAQFKTTFGGLFGGIGGGGGLTAATLGVFMGMPWLLLLGAAFVLVFGGVGFPMMVRGIRARERAKEIYQRGLSTRGRLLEVDFSSYRVNQQNALIYRYHYEADGQRHQGEHHAWARLAVQPGDHVPVLYLPEAPEQSLLYVAGIERDYVSPGAPSTVSKRSP